MTTNITETHKIVNDNKQLEQFEMFKDPPFKYIRAIFNWVILSVIIFGFIAFCNTPTVPLGIKIFFFILIPAWFFGNSFYFFYFGVSDNYLKIKNHYYFWYVKTYRLRDIKEIIFETKDLAYSLRVITKDSQSNLFQAATLHDITWLNLKAKLEEKGIIVQNKCNMKSRHQTIIF